MPTLVEAVLTVFERAKNKQIGTLVEPRLAKPNTVHDSVTKRQFGHQSPRSKASIKERRDNLRPADEKKMMTDHRRHNSLAGPVVRKGSSPARRRFEC